ncbi:flagellar M-ring protein FliF [bacterium E08(2017)]|nr:flagellar M-ring protein FliF [bacterium E08(2017)]
MANSIGVLGQQLKDLWNQFGVNQKVSTVISLLVTVGVICGTLYWSARPSFQLLYSGMSMKDAAAAREAIEDQNIKVQLKDGGRSIYVPAGEVYKCRLLLAEQGLPKDSSTGFELFEEPKFGLTDFAQKVNFQRALQGELERTISAMEGINSARVLLVLPSEKLFAAEEEKKASASIMLNVSGQASVSQAQVRSIKQLVGGAVTGLSGSSITITDQYGATLAKSMDAEDEEGIQSASEQIEMQQRLEKVLASKAQDMLDLALGKGNSIVQVSAVLDLKKIESQKQTFDNEGRVVYSETITSESSSDPVSVGAGGAGVAMAQVGNPVAGTSAESKTKKEDISTQYKVPSGIEHTVDKGIKVTSLSVSVCLAEGESPRATNELALVEEMVKTAVGFTVSDTRQDSIKVVEMAFPGSPPPVKAGIMASIPFSIADAVKTVLGVVILFVIYRGSRKAISGLAVERGDVGMPVNAMTGIGMAPSGASLGEGEEQPTIDDVMRLAEQNPKAIAAWITNVTNS